MALVNESSCHPRSPGVRGFLHASRRTRGLRLPENPPATRTVSPRNQEKERMLRTPSLFGPLNSGFVPFASGAPIDAAAEARTETAEVIARVSAPTVSARTVEIAEPVEAASSTAWAPASSARIRLVEALVVAGVCGYFGFGLLSTVIGR
jgi:hypothetical protein